MKQASAKPGKARNPSGRLRLKGSVSEERGGRRLLCPKAEVAMRVEGVDDLRTTRYIRCGR